MVDLINEATAEVVQSQATPLVGEHHSLCLQAYKAALESLGHSEYALKAGFHLNPKAVEAALQVGSLSKSQ